MIKAFLESLEDPNRPLLGPNYWLLNKLGLLLPKKIHHKILSIILLQIVTLCIVTQYLELYVIRSDIDSVITNLKISGLTFIIGIKGNSFVFWQDEWLQVIDYVTDADKFERNNQDETKANIINSYTKYCRRLTYSYWVLLWTSCVTFVTSALTKYFSSLEFREGIRNGTEAFPHLISTWTPFDKEQSPGVWITILWHTVVTFYGASITAAYDTSVMVIFVFFGGKFELLRTRCRQMLGTNKAGISDEQAERVVREIHQIHVLLLKYSELFNSVLSPVLFVYMVMCTLLLCSSAYELTSTTNIAHKIFIAEYLCFGIVQLFMFCWHSHDVIYKSSQVMLGPYESEWWAANLRQRKYVLMLQGQMQIEHMYTAGPFTNLTLPTFLAIMKGAYSYYTLLSTQSIPDKQA